MPIGASGQDRATGFLVAGVSPRRPLDDQYRAFFDLLTTQISTTVANARAYAVERRRAALAELDRAKTIFFSNVSHEFRTPLTLMLGPVADILAETDSLPASQRDRLEIAHRNGLRLQQLVNTLLDFSRIEAGRIQGFLRASRSFKSHRGAGEQFQISMRQGGNRVDRRLSSAERAIYVDPDMWEKIVLNLISNSFKFTLSGRIEVRLRESGEQVELSVHDTGVGIPAEELSKVFDRFHRVEVSRGRTQEGSGIGLALVWELVKLHGGSVRVASVIDEGSVFTVSLPKGKAHLPPDRINARRTLTSTTLGAAAFVREALRWLPAGSAHPSDLEIEAAKLNTKRPFIVLADDNADMRDYVSRLLPDRYEVVAVADGQAALDAVEVKPFSTRELLATVDTHIKTVEIRRREAYERLHLIDQLREQDRRKDEFIATLALELRNPLAPIRNGLQLIRLSNNDGARLEQATMIMQRQIEQMVRLVDDLLDIGRISRNKLELRKEIVDLEWVVHSYERR
jgi:signal transduction histidine kinase